MDKPYKEVELAQNTPEWEEWRNNGIGASDAPSIMGQNRFKSARALLYEKRNNLQPRKNINMIRGAQLEGRARKLYSEKSGIELNPLCVESIEHPWLRASLDAISNDRDHLVEIKCGKSAYKYARKRVIPPYYHGQLQHQLLITGLEVMYYWCYWPNCPGIKLTVNRNDSYMEKLFGAEQEFYELLSNP